MRAAARRALLEGFALFLLAIVVGTACVVMVASAFEDESGEVR